MKAEASEESMAIVDPEKVVREYIDAKDRHDWETVEKLLDANFVSYDPALPQPVKGIEAIRPFFKMLDGVDMKTRILSMMSKGDRVAAELEVTCIVKREGEFAGHTMPASDQPLKVTFAKFYQVNAKGQLTEEREYSDTAAKMGALGAHS